MFISSFCLGVTIFLIISVIIFIITLEPFKFQNPAVDILLIVNLLIFYTILVTIISSIFHFYNAEKGVDDCMITYVKEIKENPEKIGYWYKTPYGSLHVDTEKIDGAGEILDEFKGCNMKNNKYLFLSFKNRIYCETVYILTK